MNSAIPPDSITPARRRGFPWIPLIIALTGTAVIVWARAQPELERNMKGWITGGLSLLTLLFLAIWFFLSPRFSVRTRLIGLTLLLTVNFLLSLTVRMDGTMDGTGLPKFVWRWSERARSRWEPPPMLTTVEGVPADDPRLAQVQDVPQFFGPERTGEVRGGKLARDWRSQPPKELWRQPIGQGWSAYAVVKGRAYTQEQRGEDESVTCYDLLTGKLLWVHADRAHFSQWQGGEGPRATPTLHAGRVYAYGATGLLNCLEADTGRVIWKRSVLEENQIENLEWGLSASPLIVDDKVVVTGGTTKGPVLFAYRLDSGEPVWKAGDDQTSYASPALVTLAGKRVILINNSRCLAAHDPATGAVVMEHAWGGDKWPKASQPLIVDASHVFVSAGYGMGCQMLEIRVETDGHLTATEVWSGMKMKTQFNSPALREGHAYGLDDGRLACVDLATGDRLWKEGRFASGQSLLAGDLIIIQNESGSVHLAAAQTGGFEELGKVEALSSKTWNHPTLAGRYLLVRNDREAVCYELPVAE